MIDKGEWLSLKDAAVLLGVHRRYRRTDVALFSGTHNRPRLAEPQRMLDEVVRSVRTQVSEGRLEEEPWYRKLDEEARAQYRLSARSLFQGLMSYMAEGGEDAAAEAHSIGYEYASRARRYRLSFVDATRAFLFFRGTLIDAAIKVGSQAHVPAGELGGLFHKIHTFTDAILVSLLETYQKLEELKR